ncbi:hypothetical protein Tco_0368816 [Tanacetum coccineum]
MVQSVSAKHIPCIDAIGWECVEGNTFPYDIYLTWKVVPTYRKPRGGGGFDLKLVFCRSEVVPTNLPLLLKNFLKSLTAMAYSLSSLPEVQHSSSLDSFLAFKARNFLSTFALNISESCTYAHLLDSSFWDALDELVKEFPPDQPLIIGGDLNNHIEAAVDDCYLRRTFERQQHKTDVTGRPRILWKNLNENPVKTFRAAIYEKICALVEDTSASDACQMWNTLSRIINDMVKESAEAYTVSKYFEELKTIA